MHMKALSWAAKVLAVLATVGTVVLMFFGIAEVTSSAGEFSLSAIQMSLGSTVKDVNFNMSSKYLFAGICALIAAICSVCSVKKKGFSIANLVFSAVSMIMFIIFAVQTAASNVDFRPLTSATVEYNSMFWVLFAFSVGAVVLTIASIFLADKVEVMESNGTKKTLLKRFVAWIKEYKSEIKKISWPTIKTVVRNSVLVLLCCLLVGIIIWVVDYGLANLIQLVLKTK